ncbi:Acetylcholinesterase [Halotydeus destructor]|nr:Acetylcholinesterase [Halotydeus destructor]
MILLLLTFLQIFHHSNTVDVEIKYGVVRGQRITVLGQQVNQFVNIPYARPPVGRLRFAKPVDPLKWSPKVLDATNTTIAYCPETLAGVTSTNEDCLYLTVWTPVRNVTSPLLPVFLHLYAGDYDVFGGTYVSYNASYVSRYDVINVFPIFRGNVFGFFHGNRSDAPGNVGVWDQAQVIKWIAENIGPFGGDANRLTIAGGSSGAATALVLTLSPVTQRHVSKLVLFSSSLPGKDAATVIANSRKLARQVGCNVTKDYVACMRRIKVATLLAAYETFADLSFPPSYGDELFPLPVFTALRQGRYNKSVPLMFGDSRLEVGESLVDNCPQIAEYTATSNYSLNSTLVKECFTTRLPASVVDQAVTHYLKDINGSDSGAIQVATAKGFADYVFICPSYFVSLLVSEQQDSSGVFSYFLSYGTESTLPVCDNLTWARPCHGEESLALFGQAYISPASANATDRTYSTQLITMWSTFAKTGRPPKMGGYEWPAFQDAPVAPITPINLGSQGRPVWPSYMEVNPLKPQAAPVYKPYTDCDTFWYKHKEVFV